MARHIGIVACSAEGAALCYRTICGEGARRLGPHAHPEVSMHTHSLADYVRCLHRDDWRGVGELMLASAGKLVILIGKAPEIDGYDRRCREKALSYPFLACPDYEVPIPPRVSEANAKLRTFAQTTPNVRYFDAIDYLCPHGTCPVVEPTGEPRYYDENHLTAAASAKLGAWIIAQQGVPAAFASIAGWDASEAARAAAVR